MNIVNAGNLKEEIRNFSFSFDNFRMEVQNFIRRFHSDLFYLGRKHQNVLSLAIKITLAITGVLCFVCLRSCMGPDIVVIPTINLEQEVWDHTDEVNGIVSVKLMHAEEDIARDHIRSPLLGKLLYASTIIGNWIAGLLNILGRVLSWKCESFHAIFRGLEWFFACMEKVFLYILQQRY